ncbi:hypothetical protein INT43_005739 [Umbelopsis isabellina]|uniref:G-protein coupled receptors family 2 profile 2 domain-containing protein n=1 Tax=Mortierella isabellina TaxID=91625 RepID=A0A8H7UEJ4_MORIS|nr:hypothetical protein INT43_005739 [Umbelopsis isabellina]
MYNKSISPLGAHDADIPDLTFSSQFEFEVITQLNVICNSISIVCGMIVLTITAALRIYNKKLVDRVSLRLNAAVSATDVVNSIALLIYTFEDEEGNSCKFSAFLIIWLSNQYIFLTTAIAFNLQWLFLHNRSLGNLEIWYFVCAIGFALLTAIIPLAAGKLGFDQAQTYCWYTPSYTRQTQGFEWGTYIAPQLACLIYCLVVVVIVAIKLKRDKQALDRQLRTPWMGNDWQKDPAYQMEARLRKNQRSINRVVRRILLYPLVPIITQTGFIASEIWMYRHLEANFALNVWGVSLKALPGFFNLIAFSVDPAIYNVAMTIINDLIVKYGDQPKSSGPHNSLDEAARRRPVDSDGVNENMSEPPIASYQTESTYNETPPTTKGRRVMRWIVRNWLVPAARGQNSFIQASSSDEQEPQADIEQQDYEHKEAAPNEIPHMATGIAELGESSVHPATMTLGTSVGSETTAISRPMSDASYLTAMPVAVPSHSGSQSGASSIVVDAVSRQSHPTIGSTLYTVSTPTSSQMTPRHRRLTITGREMYREL